MDSEIIINIESTYNMGNCMKAPIYKRPKDVPVTTTVPGSAVVHTHPGVAVTTTTSGPYASGVGPYGGVRV